MPRDKFIKRVNHYPILASFFVVLLAHSTIDQGFTNQSHKTLAAAQFLAQAEKTDSLQASELDAKKALNLVQNLPQVQRKAREIKRLSRGNIVLLSVVNSSPTADLPYYVITVIENHSDKSTSPIYWFRVLSPSGVVQALDLINNQYISVDKWNPDGR